MLAQHFPGTGILDTDQPLVEVRQNTNLPWVYMVVSRATTGFPVCKASSTSSETWKTLLLVTIDLCDRDRGYL